MESREEMLSSSASIEKLLLSDSALEDALSAQPPAYFSTYNPKQAYVWDWEGRSQGHNSTTGLNRKTISTSAYSLLVNAS